MQFQLLGNTGVFVSRLCFGTMTFGGKATMFEAIGALRRNIRAECIICRHRGGREKSASGRGWRSRARLNRR
jgi:hypothetical protein